MRRQVKYRIAAEDHTGRALRSLQGNLGGVDNALRGMSTRLLGVLGIGGGLAATISDFGRFSDELDTLAKQARIFGQTSAELDAWQYVAQRAGVEASSFSQVLTRFPVVVSQASKGVGQAAETFRDLGVELKDQAGNFRPYTQVLFDIADALEKLPTAEAKAAALSGAFPEKYKDLVAVLGDGSAAVRELMVDAISLGARTDDLAGKAESLKDEQLRLNRALRGTRDAVRAWAMPALTELAETIADQLPTLLTNVSKEYRDFIASISVEPKTGLERISEEIHFIELDIGRLQGLMNDASLTTKINPFGDYQQWRYQIVELENKLKLLTKARDELARRQNLGPVVDPSAGDDVGVLAEEFKELDRILVAHLPKTKDLWRQVDLVSAAHANGVITTEQYEQALDSLHAAIRKLDPELQANAERDRRAAQIMRDLETESERYARRLAEIADLHERGNLTTEEYSLALQRLASSTETVGDRGERAMRKWGDAAETAGRGVAEAVSGAVAISTQELDGLEAHAASVLNRIMSMWLESGIAGPLADMLRTSFGAGGDSGPGPGMPGGPEGPPSPGKSLGSTGATTVNLTIQALDTRSGVEFLTQNRQAIVAVIQDSLHRGGSSVVMR